MNKIALPMVERVCGSCTACCFAVGVMELDKNIWTKCIHQSDDVGCMVHDQPWSDDHLFGFPKSCKEYNCAWLSGIIEGDERRRPDNFGVILDENAIQHKKLGKCLSGWELWEGALEDPKVNYLLEKLGNKYLIMVRKFLSNGKNMKIYGRPEIVKMINHIEIKGL